MKRFHKLTAWLLTLAMLMTFIPGFTLTASATTQTDGTCGENLTWTLVGGTLTIRGTGDMANYGYEDFAPWYEHADDITSVVIESGVTSIGNWSFFDCTALTDVEIADTVTGIGLCAFERCTSLTGVVLPNAVTSISANAFYDCNSLASVTIGSGVTTIGNGAFGSCDVLDNVVIPDNVTEIGAVL